MRKGGLYLAIGDSTSWAKTTTAGADIGAHFYAVKTRNAIRQNYGACRMLNKGIGGATSTELVQNIPWTTSVAPDLLTIGIGMNDATNQQVTVNDYKNNLRNLIDTYRQRKSDTHIILCTPNQTTLSAATPYIDSYRTAMEEVATEKNTGLCKFHLAWSNAETPNYTSDGTHPNDAGHTLMFNLLWTEVKKASWLNDLEK